MTLSLKVFIFCLIVHSWRSWRSRPALMVWQSCHPHLSARQSYWPEPLNRSPSLATAPQTSTSTARTPTCPLQPHWTWTMAPSPLTRCLQMVGTPAPMETPGPVKWRSWWGTACRRFPRVMPCSPLCPQTAPTTAAATTVPAPVWRRRSTAVSIIHL